MTVDAGIGITLVNPVLQKAEVQVGVAAKLDVTLTNNTGADIKMAAIPAPSTLQMYVAPLLFFEPEQIDAIKIDRAGWKFVTDGAGLSLYLSAEAEGLWASGDQITFTIENLVSTAPPEIYSFTVSLLDFIGRVPPQISSVLVLNRAPATGDAALPDVLQVTLDNQGSIYRSSPNDPLRNTLMLNFKNTSGRAIYTGTDHKPQGKVFVSFVYGYTAGALTFAAEGGVTQPPLGSAWNIVANREVAPVDWTPTDPENVASVPAPIWTLAPAEAKVLGIRDQANVTFGFHNVLSFNPLGHTQMYVTFTGFKVDNEQKYADHTYVLDIVKLDPPPTRGLLGFHAESPIVVIDDSKTRFDVLLRWAMFDVASVSLVSNVPGHSPQTIAYNPIKPLAYDGLAVPVPPIERDTVYLFSLMAYDGGGGLLNSKQFAVYAESRFVRDRAGRCYTTALFGNTLWMTEDYALVVAGSQKGQLPDTMLYTWEAAYKNPPDGWTLPTTDDWANLLATLPPNSNPYSQLTLSGKGGFDGSLAGWFKPNGASIEGGVRGFYWNALQNQCASLVKDSQGFTADASLNTGSGGAVRYVRRF